MKRLRKSPVTGVLLALGLSLAVLSCEQSVEDGMVRVFPADLFGAEPQDLYPLIGAGGCWIVEGPATKGRVLLFQEVWRDGVCVENDPSVEGVSGAMLDSSEERTELHLYACFNRLPDPDGRDGDEVLVCFGNRSGYNREIMKVPVGEVKVTGFLRSPGTYRDDRDILLAAMASGDGVIKNGEYGLPRHGEGGDAIYLKIRFVP